MIAETETLYNENVERGEENTAAAAIANSSGEDDEPPAKVPHVLAKYKRVRKMKKRQRSVDANSCRNQVRRYLELCEDTPITEKALHFWTLADTKQRFPTLSRLALQLLCVPASSAPIERAFSHGGIFMRPHRSRMSASLLSDLMFLKCNQNIGI